MEVSAVNSPQWLQFWAKTSHDKVNQNSTDKRYHPLIHHILDVAAVASLVWDHCLIKKLRDRVKDSFGASARAKIMFLAGAHDIGKASPYFQKKIPELEARQSESGLRFSNDDLYWPHGFISAHTLEKAMNSAVLARIAGGHHGVFPRSENLQKMGHGKLGNESWKTAREELLREFAKTIGFNLNEAAQSGLQIMDPAIVPILAGFISVADWIGSNQEFFPCSAEYEAPPGINVGEYWADAQGRAQKALEKLGWLPAAVFAEEARFDTVFSSFPPNTLQTATIELASRQTSPYLMIVEAPMGQGKTEAALYAADMAMCRGFARGMYVAMPTQATGNAMFKRVLDDYLKRRGHKGKLNLQLVHGDALLAQMEQVGDGEIPEFNPNHIGTDYEGDVEAQSWFTARKRPLLAPFGVGTIDQSLLSVLKTRHWFVRLFGLAGKVVIFDEVHAYDAYMSVILERLLHWLAEVDCTVILLSATLPEAKRKSLVKAYCGQDDTEYKRYPRITLARPRRYQNEQADQAPACEEIPMNAPNSVDLHFEKTDLDSIATTLVRRLEHGGCAAVICNTVNRSIEVYKHLRDNLKDTECSLFHARTLQMWRRDREKEVLRKFGKGKKQADGMYINPERPKRAVLVATQVIEQSLDLDFDLMVSEIAPIDLLLQRLGRLHRHPRHRPPGLETPSFIVLCDAEADGPPPESFGKGIESIYERYVLLRTWLTMRQRNKIEIPAEIEGLVEEVYGNSRTDCDDVWGAALKESEGQMEYARGESRKNAETLLLCRPKSPDDLIDEFNSELNDDEDPEVHKTVRAATREGDPSITIVVMEEERTLTDNPSVSEVRKLLDRSVKLSHRGLFKELLNNGECPDEWSRNAHLRHARLLRLDERNQGRIGDYALTVDQELGIVIEKDGGNNG